MGIFFFLASGIFMFDLQIEWRVLLSSLSYFFMFFFIVSLSSDLVTFISLNSSNISFIMLIKDDSV